MYFNPKEFTCHNKRYDKYITVPYKYPSDGATGAIDISSKGWWVHDRLCGLGLFDDGTKCTNWQASVILSDILDEEGRWFRKHSWLWATFLFGGGEARNNGMFKLKENNNAT